MTATPTTSDHGDGLDPVHAFAELARIDLTATPLGAVLRRVADVALATFPQVVEVSVSLVQEGHPRSVAFTGDLAVHLDERQYEAGFGPCLDAARTGTVVAVQDTTTDTRYADYCALAARAGIRSSMSAGFPLVRPAHGGLNLYSRTPSSFDEQTVQLARTFADYAAIALANASLVHDRTVLAGQLQAALTSRAVIEQAKGALAVRHDCSPEEAFRLMVRDSRNSNRKLREVAAAVVADLQDSSAG